jgi:hypothetical protein
MLIQQNEAVSLDNWIFDVCDWSLHVTISLSTTTCTTTIVFVDYNVHDDKTDILIHCDDPAPWIKEEQIVVVWSVFMPWRSVSKEQ